MTYYHEFKDSMHFLVSGLDFASTGSEVGNPEMVGLFVRTLSSVGAEMAAALAVNAVISTRRYQDPTWWRRFVESSRRS